MVRRKYPITITVNGLKIKSVIIDPHYENKHASYMTDKLILDLVHLLNDGDFSPNSSTDKYEYYVNDNLILNNKRYKLIWLLQKNEIYIGIINAYRSKK